MTIANNIIALALSTSGVLGIGQTAQTQDTQDSFTLLNDLIDQWNAARFVAVIPGILDRFPDLTTDVPSWSRSENALVWNLSVRLRTAFGLPADDSQIKLAELATQILQANNLQQQPPDAFATVDTTGFGLVALALRAAGRVTDAQGVLPTSQDASDGVHLLQEMLDEWQLDRTVTVTPGTFPTITDPTALVSVSPGLKSAIVWNLAVRMRAAFGADDSRAQIDLAAKSLAAVQANNKQQQPAITAAHVDNTANGIVLLALRAAGRITDTQSVLLTSQDLTDGVLLMREMLDEWQQDRTVTVTPGTFPVFPPDATTPVTMATGVRSAIMWNLATRMRSAFGLDENKVQTEQAARAFSAIQANNKQQIAPLHPGVPATPMQIIFLALRAAGRITDAQSVSDASADVDNALSLLVTMLAQWSKERWLVFDDVDVSAISTGAIGYSIGPGCAFNTVSRVDRIESAFARQNYVVQTSPPIVITVAPEFSSEFSSEFAIGSTTTIPGPFIPSQPGPSSFDYLLTVIDSREEYNRIGLKGMTSFPTAVFLDSGTPTGTVYLWPAPAAGQFEIHFSIKATLPTYATVNDPLGLPPEYSDALIYNLACRLSVLTGSQPSASLQALARATLSTIRKTNLQIPTLVMPSGVPGTRASRGFGYGGISSAIGGSGLIDNGNNRLVAG